MDEGQLKFLKRLAKGIAAQFGENCEVVVHEMDGADPEHTIVAIENSHVTHRSLGDGPSRAVLNALRSGQGELNDHLNYLTRSRDGRILKSSTIYIRDDQDRVNGIFAINYDITNLLAIEGALRPLITPDQAEKDEPEKIVQNVSDLLDELIEQSVALVGKPVALMNKEDKIRAIQFLSSTGAFLITKSGDKVSRYFGISKYTLYNYIDAAE
ncbi:transcriptional regulator [Bacillota bacterium Meth-B3]